MAKLKTGRHTGAQKTARQALRRHAHNQVVRKKIRSLAKALSKAVESKNAAKVNELSLQLQSAWDKAANSNVIHWKNAARKKSRLSRRIAAALKPPAASTPASTEPAPPAPAG